MMMPAVPESRGERKKRNKKSQINATKNKIGFAIANCLLPSFFSEMGDAIGKGGKGKAKEREAAGA